MNLEVFLSLFTLMLISLAVYLLAGRLRIPYTVLLVIVGSLLVPLSELEFFSFITSFDLTPELLFFVFLPILIFESAYNMNISKIGENARAIGLLAIVSLLISTLFVGIVAYYVLNWLRFDIPLIVLLLFGAIISSTDPVAVLSLFKEYGAPERLTLIFEGESLFNDGTSFAVFLVMLDILKNGYGGYPSILLGLFAFTTMVVGGVLFGLIMGFLFAKLIDLVRGHVHLEMTLTLLVAHFTFILAELISSHWVILGQSIRLSSIIATLVASMIIGNYGRFKMSLEVEETMEKFWSYFAFLANSIVFILMGLLFAELSIDLHVAILPILIAIAVVMLGRALSIYPVLGLLNKTRTEAAIPRSWMHLLSWGSLRGSLAVIMVLLIPDDASVPGWSYSFSLKEFIAAITIGCIYFTLLIKATTVGRVMRRLQIDALTLSEEISYYKSRALIFDEVLNKLENIHADGQLNESQYESLKEQYQGLYERACAESREKLQNSSDLSESLLALYVLGLEKQELKEIFQRDEISEKIYKKILHMLQIQCDRLERGQPQMQSPDEKFPTDALEKFINLLRRLILLPSQSLNPVELYFYYRAQQKIIEKAIQELMKVESTSLIEVFDDQLALDRTRSLYHSLLATTRRKMEAVIESNQAILNRVNQEAAQKAIGSVQDQALASLRKNEIITNKLYIRLNQELREK